MGTVDIQGFIDPSTPLDPAAQRVLAAREINRFGPTPGMPEAPVLLDWTEGVRAHFADLQNETAKEILDCVLDPVYSSSERPAAADRRLELWIEVAIPGSEQPDRIHVGRSCREVLAGSPTKPARSTIWKLTDGRACCPVCITDPGILACAKIRGLDRHRVNIRTDVLFTLYELKQGAVAWPAVLRLANRAPERWRPRMRDGFVDTGAPELWPTDPIATATVDLAVAVGQATGQHLGSLWDAALIEVLASEASHSESHRIRRKASAALDFVLEGHTWEELSGAVAAKLDTKLTRKSSVEKRVSAVLDEFEPRISTIVGAELAALEEPGHHFSDWTVELTRETAKDSDHIESRMAMAWHGGPVPEVVLRSLRIFPQV